VAAVQQSTRRFAKSQLTWFRKLPVEWIAPGSNYSPQQCAAEMLKRLEKGPGAGS
jgi:tRNA A37 N6-isopentenylltransferase MiaA